LFIAVCVLVDGFAFSVAERAEELRRLSSEETGGPGGVVAGGASGCGAADVMKVLEGVFEAVPKPRPKVDSVSLTDLLKEEWFWPREEFWPPHAAVRELKHRIQALEKTGAAMPFVVVDLRKFLPAWCPETLPVLIDSESGRITTKESYSKGIRPMQWLWAWDAYALAAVGLGQVQGFFPRMSCSHFD